jgi:hypothetical protein
MGVLAAVMGVDETAIVDAVDLELPERALGLELGDLGKDDFRVLAAGNFDCEPA